MTGIRNKRGLVFIEILVSLLILGLVSSAFFSAMGTTSRSLIVNDEQQTSKNLAEMQLEYLKGLPFASSYLPAAIPTENAGYSVQTGPDGRVYAEAISARDSKIQKLRVTILRGNKEVFTISGYKVQ
jgi:type II secretory pathway pseudopilin PulG